MGLPVTSAENFLGIDGLRRVLVMIWCMLTVPKREPAKKFLIFWHVCSVIVYYLLIYCYNFSSSLNCTGSCFFLWLNFSSGYNNFKVHQLNTNDDSYLLLISSSLLRETKRLVASSLQRIKKILASNDLTWFPYAAAARPARQYSH